MPFDLSFCSVYLVFLALFVSVALSFFPSFFLSFHVALMTYRGRPGEWMFPKEKATEPALPMHVGQPAHQLQPLPGRQVGCVPRGSETHESHAKPRVLPRSRSQLSQTLCPARVAARTGIGHKIRRCGLVQSSRFSGRAARGQRIAKPGPPGPGVPKGHWQSPRTEGLLQACRKPAGPLIPYTAALPGRETYHLPLWPPTKTGTASQRGRHGTKL